LSIHIKPLLGEFIMNIGTINRPVGQVCFILNSLNLNC
jgi:hypothetical protein